MRGVKFNDGKTAYGKGVEFGEKGISDSKWRTQHSLLRNADVYPTHGAGSIAGIWDINYKMAKEKIAPPTDAIDAAAWTVITSLSEVSIENNGEPQNFLDFTRVLWLKRKPYNWMKDMF